MVNLTQGRLQRPHQRETIPLMAAPMHPDIEIASRVIRAHLAGHNVHVWLFGSRARGDSRTWSDIDVAIQADPALPAGVLPTLREALEESNCLLNVDVVDWNDADTALRESITREGIEWNV
jgi:uncharacterized protein